MREKLKERYGSRERFRGTFEKYGLKTSYKGLPLETLLLVNVQTIQGDSVTDHLWLNLGKSFKKLGDLYPDDVLAFDARVRSYVKGYVGRGEDYREIDYKLSHPTKLKILEQAPREEDYYLVCSECGYHNRAYELNERFGRCRRCGFLLVGEDPSSLVEAKNFEQTTLSQRSLMEIVKDA